MEYLAPLIVLAVGAIPVIILTFYKMRRTRKKQSLKEAIFESIVEALELGLALAGIGLLGALILGLMALVIGAIMSLQAIGF